MIYEKCYKFEPFKEMLLGGHRDQLAFKKIPIEPRKSVDQIDSIGYHCI